METLIQKYDVFALAFLIPVKVVLWETVINSIEFKQAEPSFRLSLHEIAVGEFSLLLQLLFLALLLAERTTRNTQGF